MRKLLLVLILFVSSAAVSAQVDIIKVPGLDKATERKRLRELGLLDEVLKGGYATVGLGYVVCPSAIAPYKQGVSLNGGAGFPLIGNRIVVDVNITGDVLLKANNSWYTATLQLPANEKISSGYYGMGTVGLMPVLFNDDHNCVAAGVFAGIDMITLGVPQQQRNPPSPTTVYAFTRGAKVYYYPDEGFLLFAQANFANKNSVSIVPNPGPYDYRPVNFYTINVGVSAKFDW